MNDLRIARACVSSLLELVRRTVVAVLLVLVRRGDEVEVARVDAVRGVLVDEVLGS
jgi:hypothetical protein